MQVFKLILAAVALFTSSAHSAPVASPSSPSVASTNAGTSPIQNVAVQSIRKRANHCGDSSFVGETSGGSPSVSDCMRLHDNIAGDGTWTSGNGFREMAKYGNCKFVVENIGGNLYNMGNEDIRDVIRDAVSRFQRDGRVGATGWMDCAIWSTGAPNRVRWFIHRV